MSKSKMQIKTDATMASILAANAERVFQDNKEDLPTEEERVFDAEAASSNGKCHVDEQGFVSSKKSARSKRGK